MSELPRAHGQRRRLRDRVRYRFDNLLARGTWAVLVWLGVVTLVTVLVSSGLLTVFDVEFSGSDGTSWLEDLWQSLLRVIDPGTMAADVGWGRRLLALLITVFGLLIAGTLIGLIANGVEQRVEAMRRGRSAVIESGHVVILGASSRLPVVVEQLALANRGRRRNAIVVLAAREPVELSEEVRATAPNLFGSRLIVRWGDRTRASDLAMVGLRHARAVIALADDDAHGDAGVVTAVLAAGAALGFDRVPIVAELGDVDTATSLVRACGDGVHPVVASQTVARVTAFALREPGLSQVVEELLDFRGCDIYVREPGPLTGVSFGESVFRLATARPIGVVHADGGIDLNPDPDTRLDERTRLIVLTQDARPPAVAADGFPRRATHPSTRAPLESGRRQEHLLIIGWNDLGSQLLRAMDQIAAPGSSAEIVYDARLFTPDQVQCPEVATFDVTLTPTTSVTWQPPDDAHAARRTAIVLLAYRRGTSAEQADSRTLLNLMLLRRGLEGCTRPAPRIIVELRDGGNVELARMTGADDYVVSDTITSRLMTQLAEQPFRRPILLRLYAVDGPSVHLVPAGDLGITGDVTFGTIIASAYESGLLALGWRRDAAVVLDPHQDERVQLGEDDQIVVIG